jgi:hypothetical protein
LPVAAGFLAGKAFASYRRAGGTRRSPLPDFYIGAHAAVAGYRLLTRDRTRYATYFPKVTLSPPGQYASAGDELSQPFSVSADCMKRAMSAREIFIPPRGG